MGCLDRLVEQRRMGCTLPRIMLGTELRAEISMTVAPGVIDGNEIGGEFRFKRFHGNMSWLSVDFCEGLVGH